MSGFDVGGSQDIMFTIGPIIFGIIAVIIFGIFIFAIIYNVKQWRKNNNSPVLTVDAKVVAKRTDVSSTSSGTDHHSSARTTYYATFEVDSGDRMEFALMATNYGMLMEGDVGNLTFQGTRYLGFERNRG